MRNAVIAALVGAMVLTPVMSGVRGAEKMIEPLLPGWERFFKLDWEVVERGGPPVVRGYVVNDSPYTITRMQLLLDALDGRERVEAQTLGGHPAAAGI